MLACRNGSSDAVDSLLAAGASVHAVTPQGTTVLMQAVANGTIPVLQKAREHAISTHAPATA